MAAICFETDAYVRSHGKQPRGTGLWGFDVETGLQPATTIFAPSGLTLGAAKQWFRREVAAGRLLASMNLCYASTVYVQVAP